MQLTTEQWIWLILTAIALVVFVVRYLVITRDKVKGKKARTASGKDFRQDVRTNRKFPPAIWLLVIDGRFDYFFTVGLESSVPRFAKSLGFCSEFQTNDPAFDNRFYISSDDNQFNHMLQTTASLREAIADLFDSRIAELQVKHNQIILRFRSSLPITEEIQRDKYIDEMYALAGKLTTAPIDLSMPRSSSYKICALFQSFHILLLVMGGIGIFSTARYSLIGYGQILSDMLFVGLSAITLWLLWVWLSFHRSSYGYLVLRDFLWYGILGFLLMSYSVLYNINSFKDTSQAEVHDQTITSQYITYEGKHHNAHYHILVNDWHRPPSSLVFDINEVEYHKRLVGLTVTILTHPGYLGYEWIENHRIIYR